MGRPRAPNATGAVFASSDIPPAISGEKPMPANNDAETATGVPAPDAPSRNAPNANAMISACIRGSGLISAIDRRMLSNRPVATAMSKSKIAENTRNPSGNRPNAAPYTVATSARPSGMPYTNNETPNPAANARSEAFHEATRHTPNAKPMTKRGIAAATADNAKLWASG